MDVESKETLDAAIAHAQTAMQTVIDSAVVKFEVALRDILADTVAAMNGWELVVSPITVKLMRNIK